MAKSDRSADTQSEALPYRVGAAGVEVCSSPAVRQSGGSIPKGWPMPGKKPHQVAAIELDKKLA
jgi:hypothetical protein